MVVFPFCRLTEPLNLDDVLFAPSGADEAYLSLDPSDRADAKRLATSYSMPGAGVVGTGQKRVDIPTPRLSWIAESFRYWILTDQSAEHQVTSWEIVSLNDAFRNGGYTARLVFSRGRPGFVAMPAGNATPSAPFGHVAPFSIRPDRTLPGFDLALLGDVLAGAELPGQAGEANRRWLAGMRWMNVAINDALPDIDVRLVAAINAFETVAQTWTIQRNKLRVIQAWIAQLFSASVADSVNQWLDIAYTARSKVVHGEPLSAADIGYEGSQHTHVEIAWWTYAVALLLAHVPDITLEHRRLWERSVWERVLPYDLWLSRLDQMLAETSYEEFASRPSRAAPIIGNLACWHDLDGTEGSCADTMKSVGLALAAILKMYCYRRPRLAGVDRLRGYADEVEHWLNAESTREREVPWIDASGFPKKDAIVPALICQAITKIGANLLGRDSWMVAR